MAIGSLAVRVTSDTTKFNRGMKNAGRGAKKLEGGMQSVTKVSGMMKAAITGVAAALTAGLVAKSAQSAKELKNLAAVADTSTANFKKMAIGAREFGVEQDKLSDILKDTKDRVGDFLATGGGPMADFFENIAPKVGVTAEQFRKLSGPQALQLYVDSLERANLSQSEMTFYMEAMASDATALLPLLRNSGKEMAAQAKEAEQLGVVLSDIDNERLVQLQRGIEDGTDMFKAMTSHLSADMAPALQGVIDYLKDAAKEAGGFGAIAESVSSRAAKSFGFVLDVMHGLKVSAKTITLAFQSLGTGLLSVSSLVLEGWQYLFDQMMSGVQGLIDTVNRIPGVPDISTEGIVNLRNRTLEAAEGQRQLRREMADSVSQTAKELHNLAMQPMPSDTLDQFLKEAKEKSTKAAEEMLAVQKEMQNSSASPEGDRGGQNKEMEQRLEKLRESFKSEQTIMQEKYQADAALLGEALASEQITRQDHYHLLENLNSQHEQNMTSLEKEQAERRKGIAKAEAEFKKKALGDALSNLSTLMNTESRKMFEIGKAAALAQALIDGKAAVVGAYKVGASMGGPWLGAAYAAAAGAATLSQIQSIRSQSFGSGGGAAGSVTQQASAGGQPVQQQQQQQQTTTSNIRVEGLSGEGFITNDMARALLGKVEEQWRDGAGSGRFIFD